MHTVVGGGGGQVFPCKGLKAFTAFEENVTEDITCQVDKAMHADLG